MASMAIELATQVWLSEPSRVLPEAPAFHVEGMADAVAWAAVPEAELLTDAAQKR